MSITASGWIELTCSECGKAYAALYPHLDEIEWPVCSSCRDALRLLGPDPEENLNNIPPGVGRK